MNLTQGHEIQTKQISTKLDFTNCKVLVVDDEETNLDIAEYMLTKNKFKVTTAKNGIEAIGKLLKNEYDLILLDCLMPEIDGYKTCELIREIEHAQHLPAIPIIALTANVSQECKNKCLTAGMNDFVSKPYKIDTILTAISNVFQAQRAKSAS